MDLTLNTPEELQEKLGAGIRSLRLQRNVTQRELAVKGGISPRALTNLENGKGSSVETLVRALKALDATDTIAHLAPQSTISPMALLRTPTPPRRVRRPRGQSSA